ncbi:MAG: hypothetical protein V3S01_07920 [Dehalococcoidia bacterium]
MINVRTHDATGRVLGWGESPLDGAPGAGETDAQVAGTVAERLLLNTVGPHHCKVIGGAIEQMTQAEKDASDLDRIPVDERRARQAKAAVSQIAAGTYGGTVEEAQQALARGLKLLLRDL